MRYTEEFDSRRPDVAGPVRYVHLGRIPRKRALVLESGADALSPYSHYTQTPHAPPTAHHRRLYVSNRGPTGFEPVRKRFSRERSHCSLILSAVSYLAPMPYAPQSYTYITARLRDGSGQVTCMFYQRRPGPPKTAILISKTTRVLSCRYS